MGSENLKLKSMPITVLFSKTLHHISVGNATIKEMTFDIDCMIAKMQSTQPKVSSPVDMTGLAHTGTAILLESLCSQVFSQR